MVTEVISRPMLWFMDWPSVSTSFVARLRTSPLLEVSKYLRGRRLIFFEMSVRNLEAIFCETVARM